MRRWLKLAWLLVPLAALVELGYHQIVELRVPRDSDWQEASAEVRAGFREGDLIVISPWWASQGWVYLGDLVTVEQMSREDDEGYGRIWEVALPGHRHEHYASTGRLVRQSDAGRLTVRLYEFPDAPKNLFDFVSAIESHARVSMIPDNGGAWEACTFRPNSRTGLVPNSAVQTGKWKCDQRLPWNYVAREVIADLDNRPRLCLWAHPVDGKTIHIEFSDVPEGAVIEGHVGRRYEADRESIERPPIYLDVTAADVLVGTAAHEKGGGWTPYSFELGSGGTQGKVSFDVHSPQTGMAHFCFTAKLRDR